ncbi:MAG: hypothetical protein L6Q92_08250 [Phycisphaerae bacterium]|nr:hypothetical protein [Phycisphaerae bacterium]
MTSRSEGDSAGERAAVVMADGRDRPRAEEWAQSFGLTLESVHAAGELDDLDELVREQRVRHVVFERADDLWRGAWDRQLDLSRWPMDRVRVHFIAPVSPAPEQAIAVVNAWRSWDASRRRRQMIAGVALSALALLAAFGMTSVSLWWR